MKRPIVVAAICILCAIAAAGFLYTTAFQKRVEKADIIEYVQTNQEALEQFATGLLADPPGVTAYNEEWQISWYPDRPLGWWSLSQRGPASAHRPHMRAFTIRKMTVLLGSRAQRRALYRTIPAGAGKRKMEITANARRESQRVGIGFK